MAWSSVTTKKVLAVRTSNCIGDTTFPFGRRWGRPAGDNPEGVNARVSARRLAWGAIAGVIAVVAFVVWPAGHRSAAGSSARSRDLLAGASFDQLRFPSVEAAGAGSAAAGSAGGDVPMPAAPDSFDAPAPPPPPPPPALRQANFPGVVPTGGTWAVVIGINDYPGTSHDLQSAVNDANDMVRAMEGLGVPGDHILLLKDGTATAANIDLSADWLVAHSSPDAVAAFFYAGHVRKLAAKTEAIVGADGNLVRDTELAQHLSRLTAKRTWIGMASCYGGGFDELLGPGRILTGAAGANQIAYENEGFGRSYMVEYMVDQAIIQNRASATIQSAFTYASDALHHDYPGREPVELGDQAAPLDLRPPGAPPAPPPSGSSAPAPSKPAQSTTTTSTTTPPDTCKSLTGGVIRCAP
jgi:hypothetical protein